MNFPTTNEYTDLKVALSDGKFDSGVSYQIDICGKNILNLSKLSPTNHFLHKRYEVYDSEPGVIFRKTTFKMGLDENIAFRPKTLSSRTKTTKADDLMKGSFDAFLGL